MLTDTSIELRSAKPSLAMRAVTWLMNKRRPVFPHAPADFEAMMATRTKPTDAKMPGSFERRFDVEKRSVDGCEVVTLHPKTGPGAWHMLYFHGGGFVLPMFKEHWPLAQALVERVGVSVTVPMYDVVPEASASDQDALADAVFADLAQAHDPARIVLCGDSAGGHMALSLAVRLAASGGPQAGRLALFAPWLDVTLADPAIAAVEPHDIMLKIGTLRSCGRMFAGSRDPASPECSPLYLPADALKTLPPTRIWTGRHDLFIVDSRSFTGRLREAGVDAKLYEYEACPHVFMAITRTREAKDVFRLLKQFLKRG
ncbi:MAG: alpha/beta hydrolase [Erythrobacter sp.]|uniref:alpha/beta hydrolase n=1 Tax=Erythrobacter sp. TaxID=1042 RepID=UPI00260318B1|nr:alpha/beta hydrolase [Erythrobacter sp.]MDJ0979275.1 alpha/beta hydrolase [Erythrobacter sp.]